MEHTGAHAAIGIILARGGSKGIPGKNLQHIGGVSLVGRAIQAADAAETISTVLVSTDDANIRKEAEHFGAHTVDRPSDLAGDNVTSEAAMVDALQQWEDLSEKRHGVVALIQATSPFTTPNDIDRVIAPIREGNADSTLTVVDDYGYFWFKANNGWHLQHQLRDRRQHRLPWKRESGNVYAVRYDLFMRDGSLFPGRVQTVTIPPESAFEIDEPGELLTAKALNEHYQTSE